MEYQDLATFSQGQANQSFGAAPAVQNMADPFSKDRAGYQNFLKQHVSPQGFRASYDAGKEMLNDELRKRAAGTGKVGSGNYLADLMKYGEGLASQRYFGEANLLAQLAQGGSSPSAAALSWSNMVGRGQDQAAIGKVSRSLGNMPQQGGRRNWLQEMNAQMDRDFGQRGGGGGTGLPSGGALPTSYSGMPGTGYMPSEGAGTGYVQSDYGMTNFGGGDYDYTSFDPSMGGGFGGGGDTGVGSFMQGGGGDWQIPSYDFGEEY